MPDFAEYFLTIAKIQDVSTCYYYILLWLGSRLEKGQERVRLVRFGLENFEGSNHKSNHDLRNKNIYLEGLVRRLDLSSQGKNTHTFFGVLVKAKNLDFINLGHDTYVL